MSGQVDPKTTIRPRKKPIYKKTSTSFEGHPIISQEVQSKKRRGRKRKSNTYQRRRRRKHRFWDSVWANILHSCEETRASLATRRPNCNYLRRPKLGVKRQRLLVDCPREEGHPSEEEKEANSSHMCNLGFLQKMLLGVKVA